MDASAASASPVDLPDGVSFVETSGDIECYRLDANDLRVLLLPEDGAPVATLMVTYHVGSRNEVTGLTGATHFLEHLMFKGTERFHKRKGTSIFNTLQRVGAEVNASTWVDRTNYYEMMPTEHLPLAVEIEADRMRNALLDPEDLASERTVILNEYDRTQNDPVSRLFDEVWSAAFVAHPYHHPTIGWRSDIESVTREGLQHFYDTYYWPNNATVSVIGSFDRREVLEQIVARFGAIDASPEPVPEVTTREPRQRGPRRVRVHQDGQLGALLKAFKAPPATDPDSDALDVLARILASGKASRLYRRCTDAGLTSDVYGLNYRLRDAGLFSVFAYLAPAADHAEVESIVDDVLDDVRRHGVTPDERDRAVTQLRAKTAFDRDGSMQVASQLNEALAAGDWKLYTEYVDRLQNVTVDDVQRVANEYLVDDNSTTGWYVPTESDGAQARDDAPDEALDESVDGESVDGETVDGETVDGETLDGETVDASAAGPESPPSDAPAPSPTATG